MSDPVKKDESGFSSEYVKELREENAKWRSKVRDLETQFTGMQVKLELDKRGVKADPSWVKLQEGEEVSSAINRFVNEHPHLVESTSTNDRKLKAMNPGGSNSNYSGPGPGGTLTGKTMSEIQKDPKARSVLREKYRELLRQQSNRKDSE
jgi:hypothetical protein